MSMNIDISQVPFSRRGSYFAVSRMSDRPGLPEGIYLRTVHGGSRNRDLFRIEPAMGEAPFTFEMSPASLRLETESCDAVVSMPDARSVTIAVGGDGARLTGAMCGEFDLVVQRQENRWELISFESNLNVLITCLSGEVAVEKSWTGVKDAAVSLLVTPRVAGEPAQVVLQETTASQIPPLEGTDSKTARAESERDYLAWLAKSPAVPERYESARALASYVNWSSVVEPGGLVRRPTMLMSKNWMTNVWSWDHCFNAMALLGDLPQAMDQMLTLFDHQHESGALPDSFNDGEVTFNFVKPPIHGWALRWMMQRVSFPVEFLEKMYDGLASLTRWWLRERDYEATGRPLYNHGNDSGWDNSTVFASSVPVASPDLCAFLVIQLDVLSELAVALGRQGESGSWATQADALLEALIDHYWIGDRFIARRSPSGEAIETQSLLMYMPLVLGERLPREIFSTLVDGLHEHGMLTEWGLATESPSSPLYEADGYWRGPIWAPSTLLIVDGLARGGEPRLAQHIAELFCDLCDHSGMAENFDALSGAGLRDRAYTWTSSVFLVLASEYLRLAEEGRVPQAAGSRMGASG